MKTIEQIRHARLIQILEMPEYPTIQRLADALERSHAQVSQWKNQSKRRNKQGEVTGISNIDSESARHIERKIGKPTGWMDNDPARDERPINVRPARTGAEPSFLDFEARDVTDSEWALLEDLRVMPEDTLAEWREKAAKNREHFDRIWNQRQKGARQDNKISTSSDGRVKADSK